MIITQFAVLALLGLVAMLWRRTHRLERNVRGVKQELEIQRIVIDDQPDAPPERRRHLRSRPLALALFV